jgi:transposase InsO family protein
MRIIDAHREKLPLRRLCALLGVSETGWRKWKRRQDQPGKRAEDDELLGQRIAEIHCESRGNYGSPRVWQALRQEGIRCGRKRVARLMKERGLRGRSWRRKRVRTTLSEHGYAAAPNLLATHEAQGPNEIWQADITYVRLEHGWLYLAAVLDAFTRKIVGWNMREDLSAELALGALEMALEQQRPGPGLIHHSDRGVQYACHDYQQRLEQAGVRCSMSRKGNCYDNATMESFFGTLKREQIDEQIYADARVARLDIFAYIEGFYNPRRIHTSLSGLSPQQKEDQASGGVSPLGQLFTPPPPTSLSDPFSESA